jgi:signal transduction histidine kinase
MSAEAFPVSDARSSSAPRTNSVASLISSSHVVPASTPIGDVVRLFERHPEADSVAVADGSRLAMVVRPRFFLQLGRRFGYSLFENREVRLLAEEGSTVDASADPVEVVTLALAREPSRIYDDLLVIDCGKYLGTVSLRTLMAHHKDVLRASMAEISLLDERNQRLSALNEMQAEFMANMTHELRSPLNTMLGATRLLADDPQITVTQRRQVDLLARRGQELSGIIDNVLDLARLEAGRWQPLFEPVDLDALFEDALHAAEPLVLGKPVRVALKLMNLPRDFVTDPVFLQRIVTNLLSNAAKFTDGGMVVLGAAGDGHWLTVHISDTGVGMRAEDLPRLFTRFTQLEATRTKRHAGTGLGLTIVKGLVDQLQGSVSVESREGAGTTFTVRLPDARAQMPRN